MKKIFALLMLLCIMFSYACQTTPEQHFVQSKNDGELEGAIYGAPAPNEAYSAPPTWIENFSNDDESIVVNIDASLTIPNVTAYPVYRIDSPAISEEEMNAFIQAMIGDEPLYTVEGTTRTKKIIEDEIESILAQFSDPNSKVNQMLASGEITQKEYEDDRQYANEKVKQLREEYKSAPYDITYEEIERIYQLNEYRDDVSQLRGVTRNNDSTFSYIEIQTRNKSPYYTHQFKYFSSNFDMDCFGYSTIAFPNQAAWSVGDWKDKTENLNGMELTYEEAKEFADGIVYEKLGYDNYDLAHVHAANYEFSIEQLIWDEQYMFIYTPTVDEIPVLYYTMESFEVAADNVTLTEYGPIMYPRYVSVYVKDTKNYEVYEQSTFVIDKQLTSNTPLLPFDEIQDIFRKYMLINPDSSCVYSKTDAEGNKCIVRETYNITDIQLGYIRIIEKDNSGSGLLVPVWNFYGQETATFWEGETTLKLNENNEFVFDDDPGNAFLCINAIDGSIIDLDKGY